MLRGAWAIVLLPFPAIAAQPQPAPPTAGDPEIIIEGRRAGERYRLPTDMRGPPPEASRAPAAADARLACAGVGAYGCGTEVLPIVTVRGDGSVQIGAPEGR